MENLVLLVDNKIKRCLFSSAKYIFYSYFDLKLNSLYILWMNTALEFYGKQATTKKIVSCNFYYLEMVWPNSTTYFELHIIIKLLHIVLIFQK